MSARKIRNSWWVDFRFEGKRIRLRSPDNSHAGALAYEKLLIGRLVRGDELRPTTKFKQSFLDFSVKWFNTYVLTNNKPSEQRTKESVLRNHLLPALGRKPLDEISSLNIEEYKSLKLQQGLSAKSINNHLTILRKCFQCAVEWELIPANPRFKMLKTPPQTIDFLSDEECDKLLADRGEPRSHAMILTALRTGLRLGELCALEWTDIDLNQRRLTVQRSVVRGIVASPKSNRIRHIPMTSDLTAALASLRQPFGLVFSRPKGQHLSDIMATQILRRNCKKSGLRRISWHLLRHTFASQLVMRGVPMRAVQELLGHSTIVMTERYAHLAPSSLSDAITMLDPLVANHPVGTPWSTMARISQSN